MLFKLTTGDTTFLEDARHGRICELINKYSKFELTISNKCLVMDVYNIKLLLNEEQIFSMICSRVSEMAIMCYFLSQAMLGIEQPGIKGFVSNSERLLEIDLKKSYSGILSEIKAVAQGEKPIVFLMTESFLITKEVNSEELVKVNIYDWTISPTTLEEICD